MKLAETYGGWIVKLGRCFVCQQPIDDHHLIVEVDFGNLVAAAKAGRSDLRFFKCPQEPTLPKDVPLP